MCDLTLTTNLPALNKITVGFGEIGLFDGQGPNGQSTNVGKGFSIRDFVTVGTDGGRPNWYRLVGSSSNVSQSKSE